MPKIIFKVAERDQSETRRSIAMIAFMAGLAALMSLMFVGLMTNAWVEFQREIRLDDRKRKTL